MSYSHYWFSRFLDDDEVAALRPTFDAATAQVRRTAAQEAAYRQWLDAGECIDMRDSPRVAADVARRRAEWFNEFVWIFNPEPFRDVGSLVMDDLAEDNCGAFLIVLNCAPVAVLWQALGAARAARLPGLLGNLLVPADGVEAALAQTREALAGLDLDRAIERGHALCGFRNEVSSVRPVLDLLPNGLQRALELRRGFAAVARQQV